MADIIVSWVGFHQQCVMCLARYQYSILSTECCVADDFSAIACITLSRECYMADKVNTIIYINILAECCFG